MGLWYSRTLRDIWPQLQRLLTVCVGRAEQGHVYLHSIDVMANRDCKPPKLQ
jgi:hypothetical protein